MADNTSAPFPIRNAADYDRATRLVERLWTSEPGSADAVTLAIMADLITLYDIEHHKAPVVDVVRLKQHHVVRRVRRKLLRGVRAPVAPVGKWVRSWINPDTSFERNLRNDADDLVATVDPFSGWAAYRGDRMYYGEEDYESTCVASGPEIGEAGMRAAEAALHAAGVRYRLRGAQ